MGTPTKKVEIKIEGVEAIDSNFYKNYDFSNIVMSQQLLRPCELSFTIQKKSLSESIKDSNFPLPKKLMGAKVSITIVAVRFDNEKEKMREFKGIIYNVSVRRRSDMFTEQLIDVRACTPDYLLMDHPHCFSYEDMSLSDIVSKTIKPYESSLSNEIKPRTKESVPYTVQYNETNYQFLTRLAQRYGEWMYHDGLKWYFGEIKRKDTVELDPRNDILDYQFQAELTHHKLKHAHHNYKKYENPVKSYSDISGLSNSGYHVLTDDAWDKSDKLFSKETFQHLQCSNPEFNDMDEIEKSAKVQLFGEKMQQVVCTGSTLRADLTIGSVIKIKDRFYNDDKVFDDKKHDELIITGIVHYTEVDGHYSNSFTAYPAKSEMPPYYQSDLYPFSSAQRAVVKENNDPEKLGRVRVQFLWQEEQDDNLMTPWIRIAQPYGGHNKGIFFIPEKNEEVMVDFENGNAEKPFVVGTLYHYGDQRPRDNWYDPDSNDAKIIRSRNGHTILFEDKGDGGYISIYDAYGDPFKRDDLTYQLDFSTDDKLISLQSYKGNIELRAKENIEIYAEKDVIVEAGGNIKMKAKSNIEQKADSNITSNAGGDVSSEAGNNMSLKAKVKMSLESVNHEQKASASMKLDGGGQLEAKAGMVKIN